MSFIPQMEPWFSIEERNAVSEYMDEEDGLLSLKELKLLKI